MTSRTSHHRTGRPRLLPAIAAGATALTLTAPASSSPAAAATGPDTLQRQFSAAADEFHVPQNLLLALSYQQTRWESHRGAPSTTGNYNVMGLTQVDVAAVDQALAAGPGGEEQDGRGDDTRPAAPGSHPVRVADSPALHTLDAAAKLVHQPADRLRTDSGESIRGAAALLAEYQRDAGRRASTDPADWYGAVARFAQPDQPGGTSAGAAFADRVYRTVRQGAIRTTADGQRITLPADPAIRLGSLPRATYPGSSGAGGQGSVECPPELDCDFQAAAYALAKQSDPTSYGNYDVAHRPDDRDSIQYIVIHDTEAGFSSVISAFQHPNSQASAHYVIRSSDGHVTQMVNTRNIAWHAGNKTINMHSIGIEHEGYAWPSNGATWYSEQLYQSSAALVRYLAARFDIPLDRQHIIGHDDVPGPTQANVAGMHWDPGTIWDWSHYLDLLGATVRTNSDGPPAVGGKVTIIPAFDSSNQPPVDGGSGPVVRPQNFVYLRTQPSANAPLINNGTTAPADWHDKAVAGTSYVVADQRGNWTAIWYDGQQAWFYNPDGSTASTDDWTGQTVLVPAAGRSRIPVYGRAYPETAAYAPYPGIGNPAQPVPLNATIAAGQAYLAASDTPMPGDFYYAQNINGDAPNDRTLVVGQDTYFPIRFNHRLAFVKSTDVEPQSR